MSNKSNTAAVEKGLRALGETLGAGKASMLAMAQYLFDYAEYFAGDDGPTKAFKLHAEGVNKKDDVNVIDLENKTVIQSGASKMKRFILLGSEKATERKPIIGWTVEALKAIDKGARPNAYETLLNVVRLQLSDSETFTQERVVDLVNKAKKPTKEERDAAKKAKAAEDAEKAKNAPAGEDKREGDFSVVREERDFFSLMRVACADYARKFPDAAGSETYKAMNAAVLQWAATREAELDAIRRGEDAKAQAEGEELARKAAAAAKEMGLDDEEETPSEAEAA